MFDRVSFLFLFVCRHGCMCMSRDEVVDTIAVREFEVPGAKHKSDTLSFLLDCFAQVKRPLARVRKVHRARGKRSSQMKGFVLPCFSHRVLGIVFDFVGLLIDDDREMTLIGNSDEQFAKAAAVLSVGGSVRRASYGWHPEQLSAAEYVAVVSREVSANLDLMSEARRRPRPAQVQPSAEDNAEDLGLRAEYVEVEGSDGSVDADDLEHVPLVKPDVQYQPRLHVDQGDVLTLAHRLTVKTGGPGKVSASTQRATEFVKQYAEKYVEIQRPRACHREDASGDVPMSMPLRQGDIHMGLKHQSNLLEARKEKDVQAGAESDDEFTTHISSREIEAGVAPFARVLTLSPAEKAMQLLQQKLPVVTDVVANVAAVASGAVSNFAISGDQYNVVILAIAPLQRLWEKAKDKQMVSHFGDPNQTEKLLDLITPVPRCEFILIVFFLFCLRC